MALQEQEVTLGGLFHEHLTGAEEQLQGHPSLLQGCHPTATRAQLWAQTCLALTAVEGTAGSQAEAQIPFLLGWTTGRGGILIPRVPSALALPAAPAVHPERRAGKGGRRRGKESHDRKRQREGADGIFQSGLGWQGS